MEKDGKSCETCPMHKNYCHSESGLPWQVAGGSSKQLHVTLDLEFCGRIYDFVLISGANLTQITESLN